MQEPIEDFLDDVKAFKSENTHNVRKYDLKKYNNYLEESGLDVTEVESSHIHDWLADQADKFAGSTVAGRFDSVKLLYEFLVDVRDLMDESPVEDLKRSKFTGNGNAKKHENGSISYVTPEEVEQLCESAPDPKLRNELLIRLMFQTGMRESEAARVQIENIDRDNRSIRIYSPKTDDWRTVHYQSSLDFLFDQWIDGYRGSYRPASESPYLFVTRREERMRDERPNEIVRNAADAAGIQETLYVDAADHTRVRITAHTLRHGHAVNALKSGIDVRAVAGQLGHKKIETTMQYLQYVNSDVAEAYEGWQ